MIKQLLLSIWIAALLVGSLQITTGIVVSLAVFTLMIFSLINLIKNTIKYENNN